MDLEPNQIAKAQKIFLFIKGLWFEDPAILERAKIKKCDDCEGTGLAGYNKSRSGDYSWTGQYCDSCKGIGYRNLDGLINLEINETTYICGECYGVGCDNCKGTGRVDWITHSMGR